MAQSYLLSSRDLEDAVRRLGFDWMDLRPAHAVMAGRLPRLHSDPLKKMLSAQALIENAMLLTRDPGVLAYGPVVACEGNDGR
jgi:PIN domain nuclease of toxin-antitoxin system